MKIRTDAFPFPLSDELVEILESELAKIEQLAGTGVIVSFSDPDYSAESGGFHPVEISISSSGRIQYITDFAYVGMGPFSELAKEIDFDIDLGMLQHFGREYPLREGRELFSLWQRNFISYYQMAVYQVSVEVN